mgnify:CR=1 FL=1
MTGFQDCVIKAGLEARDVSTGGYAQFELERSEGRLMVNSVELAISSSDPALDLGPLQQCFNALSLSVEAGSTAHEELGRFGLVVFMPANPG